MNNTASDKYDLSNANFKDLITEFFEFYTTPAFGARSKSEIDLKVFELLGKCGYMDDDYYNVSRKLKITPTRARNLLLNLELRTTAESTSDDLNNVFEYLKNFHLKDFREEKRFLTVYLPSLLQREMLKHLLRKANKTWDTSFNSEILKIYIDDFIDIIPDNMKKELKREKRNSDLKNTVIELLNNATVGSTIGTILSKLLNK